MSVPFVACGGGWPWFGPDIIGDVFFLLYLLLFFSPFLFLFLVFLDPRARGGWVGGWVEGGVSPLLVGAQVVVVAHELGVAFGWVGGWVGGWVSFGKEKTRTTALSPTHMYSFSSSSFLHRYIDG